MCDPVVHTGPHSQQIAVAVIPARYSSSRLPGKPLLEIAGKPLIVWVAERADAASAAAVDVVMTRADHQTGTDRIAEVAHTLRAEIIVNVQGDEPLIDPATIDRVVNALSEDATAQMATTYESIEDAADVLNPSVVKIAFGEDGCATNFSRNPIPYPNQAVEKYGSIEAALRQEPALLFS